MDKCVLSTNERAFIHDTLEQIRIDGRQQYDYRSVNISFQQEKLGQVQVSLGKTKVIAVVSCDVAAPLGDRGTEGYLLFNTELSPMAGQHYAKQRNAQSEASIEISRVIERALRGSGAIDTEALCIVSGEKVWSIRVDLHVIDDHGNVMDCAHLAAITALLHYKRPEVTIGEDGKVTIHETQDRDPVPLSVHHIPICVSFGFLGDGTKCLIDPSLKEEEMLTGSMTVAANTHGQICAVQKGGGVPVHSSQILTCTKIAALKAKDLTDLIETSIRNDEKQRKFNKLPAYARPKEAPVKVKPVITKQELIDLNEMVDSDDEEEGEKDVVYLQELFDQDV
ncbi:exosome complex protein RPR45, partial [Acrasis kona]